MIGIKQYRELKVPAKASLWYIGSGGFARAVGALSTPLFTRLLAPSEYGLYPLYNSWLGLFTVIVTLEITGTAIYRGYQIYAERKDEFTSCALGLISTIFIAFCLLYFIFYRVINTIVGLNKVTVLIMLIEIFASAILSLYIAKAKFEYNYKAVALFNILLSILSPIGAIVLIYSTSLRAEARIFSSAFTTLFLALPVLFIIIKASSKLFDASIWKFILLRALSLIPHYFASALILKSIEISIGRSHGTEALARYSVAVSIGMILTIVTAGMLSALSPWILRKMHDNNIDSIRSFLLLSVKWLSLIALIILAIAPELIAFLAAKDFRLALPSVYPLEIAVIFSFLSGAVMSGCTYYERRAVTSLPSVSTALLSILFSFFIIPRVDYRFSGIFALFSYLLLALLSSILFKHLFGDYPISIGGTACVLLFTLGYAFLLYILIDHLALRILLTLPPSLLLLITTNTIWKNIRE